MYLSEAVRLTLPPHGVRRVVIIGAGAVGLYAASQLAAKGCQAVVVEAGDSQLGKFDHTSWKSIGRAHNGIRLARARNLGGTTSLWGGQLVEFQPVDLGGRDWLPSSKWPISHEEIASYYPSTYLRLGIPPHVLEDSHVWRDAGARQPDLGPLFEVFLTRWMGIPNFAELFERQIESDFNMLVLRAHVAVGFRGADNVIEAVRVIDREGQSHWITGDSFLLAAGTIENVRLLLHTEHDPQWTPPWAGNPNIGLFFQDHLAGRVGEFHPANKRDFLDGFANLIHTKQKFHPKIRMRNEVMLHQQIYNIQAWFSFESEISEHLVFLKQFLKAALYSRKLSGAGDLFRKGLGIFRFLFPLMWKYVWDHRVFVPSTAKTFLLLQAEHGSSRKSRISIDRSMTDAFGLPRVILDWQLRGGELASLRSFALQIRDALRNAAIGELEVDQKLLDLNPEYLDTLYDNYHQSGGAIMATSEECGVVDLNLRVFGTSNLYVGGACVFPTTSNANVTFHALALTSRLIDHLSGLGPPMTGVGHMSIP